MSYINRIYPQPLDSNSPIKSIIICQIALKIEIWRIVSKISDSKNNLLYKYNPVFCGLCKESWCIKAVFIKKSLQNDIFSILIAIFAKEL